MLDTLFALTRIVINILFVAKFALVVAVCIVMALDELGIIGEHKGIRKNVRTAVLCIMFGLIEAFGAYLLYVAYGGRW